MREPAADTLSATASPDGPAPATASSSLPMLLVYWGSLMSDIQVAGPCSEVLGPRAAGASPWADVLADEVASTRSGACMDCATVAPLLFSCRRLH